MLREKIRAEREIKVIKNKKEKGFAENHNFAFMESSKWRED